MRFEAITFASLCKSLEAEFRYKGVPQAVKVSVIAEHIRGIVDGAFFSNSGGSPVEVSPQKLALEVRRRVAPLFISPDGTASELSVPDEIDAMVSLNEIWRSTTGGYVISPPRLIAIDDASSLLIGGGVTRILPKALRKQVEQAGRARVLPHAGGLEAELENIPVQSLQSWLGLSRENAHAWSSSFIESVKLSAPLDDEADSLVVRDGRSWVPLEKYTGALGRRLARSVVSVFGSPSFQYYLCNLKMGAGNSLTVESLVRIDRQEARRLQPIMGSNGNHCPILRCEMNELQLCIEIWWPLPEPESKILHLGWMHATAERESSWPRKYCFSSKLYPLLVNAFDVLGYSLKIHTN